MSGPGSSFHFVVPGPIDRRTGGSIYDYRIAQELPSHGWIPELVELDGIYPLPDATAEEACAKAVDALPQGARILVDGLAAPAMVSHLCSRPDVSLVLLCHHPVVLEPGWTSAEKAALQAQESAAFAQAQLVIAPSKQTLDDAAAEKYRLAEYMVIAPGSDAIDPPPPTRTGRGDPGRLLCVASLIPRKGHDNLLEALTLLADIPLVLTCVGSPMSDPKWSEKLRNSAESDLAAGRVIFAGEVGAEELRDHYGTADLFVLPSRHEGFGMVLSEALRWGLPLVTTDAGAIREAAPSAATTFVPVDDPPALANALRELLENQDAYTRAAAAASSAGRALPDWTSAGRLFAQALSGVWGPG